MARYLGVPLDTSFLFGILPGVCREAIGRYDFMYTNYKTFNSDKTYAWSEHHYNKINNGRFSNQIAYYGTCPFLWELGRVAAKGMPDPKGSLFFLPRDDQVTIRDESYKEVESLLNAAPKPVSVLVPWRSCDIWKQWTHINIPHGCNLIQMSDRLTRQEVLSKLFLQHQHIYIPWPGTDVYYAEFMNKDIVVYDKLEQYRTKQKHELEREMDLVLNYLKWGYDFLSDRQKTYFEWTRNWMSIDKRDRQFLANRMLGVNILKSPQDLYDDLISIGWLEPHVARRRNIEYERSYDWLRERVKNVSCTSKGLEMLSII